MLRSYKDDKYSTALPAVQKVSTPQVQSRHNHCAQCIKAREAFQHLECLLIHAVRNTRSEHRLPEFQRSPRAYQTFPGAAAASRTVSSSWGRLAFR